MTEQPKTDAPNLEAVREMIALSRRQKLPRLLLALDRLHGRLSRGERVDAAALAKLEEMAAEEIKAFEKAPPLDLSKLTDRQLSQLERLMRIATGQESDAARKRELIQVEELKRELAAVKRERDSYAAERRRAASDTGSASVAAVGPSVACHESVVEGAASVGGRAGWGQR